MNTVSSIALSGLRGAQMRIDTSAHNIANAQTPGFRRQLVAQQSQEGGGVLTQPVTTAERPLEAPPGEGLADDIVGQKVASYAFAANLLVLKTHDRMQGTLFDAFA